MVAALIDRSTRGRAVDRLTARQGEVLAAIAQGQSNAAIARSLSITEKAVVQHTSHLYDELDLPISEESHRRVLAVLRYLAEYAELMRSTSLMTVLTGRGSRTLAWAPARCSSVGAPHEVAKRMAAEETGYGLGGQVFVLTHRPPEEPERGVTFLSCGLAEAVDTARAAAGGKNLEILGAALASQCLKEGLVDEVLVYVLPVLMGDGVRFSTLGLGRIDLEPFSNTQSGPVTMLRFRVRK